MIKHKLYDTLQKYAGARDHKNRLHPIILTGPASTGKSNACEQLAEELGMNFSYMACNQQMTKSDLIGFKTPNGDAVDTLFTKAYSEGGIFVLEEIDAANPNVLLTLNTAIAGDTGSFSSGIVKRHPDFLLVATANTYGGSTEQYSARAKLDASTLSRFLKLEWEFDEDLEAVILNHKRIHSAVKTLRREMFNRGYELLMRDVISYKSLLNIGIDYKDAARSTVIREMDENQHSKLLDILYVKPLSTTPITYTIEVEEPLPEVEEVETTHDGSTGEDKGVEATREMNENGEYTYKKDYESAFPSQYRDSNGNTTTTSSTKYYQTTRAEFTDWDNDDKGDKGDSCEL